VCEKEIVMWIILALLALVAALAARSAWRFWRTLPRRNADFDPF